MAGTTTYYGISYPTSTDYVKDGATAMQTIATGFDSAVAIPTYNNQTGTSYTFVLADAGKTVTSDNASAVTFTIPPQSSVAWANNTTLTVRNLGAGVVTIAGGSGVTVTNTAQTVAQYGEVKLIRTASNAWTVVPASGGASGLTLIAQTSYSAQTQVDITNCFSSTYQNYKIITTLSGASTAGAQLLYLLSGTTPTSSANYFTYGGINNTGTAFNAYEANKAYNYTGIDYTSGAGYCIAQIDISSPFESLPTKFTGTSFMDSYYSRYGGGVHNASTSYNGIRFSASAGNMTGTIRVYGYQNS